MLAADLKARFLQDQELDALRKYHDGWANDELHCPTCGELPGVQGTYQYLGALNICKLDEFGRHEQRVLYDLYCLAGIPKEFMTLGWEDFPTYDDGFDVKRFVDDFLERFKFWKARGRGFTFHGTFGTGKTWACCHIAKELAQQGMNVYYVSFQELVGLYTVEKKKRDWVDRRMLSADLLVIDDVLLPTSDKQRDLFESRLEDIVRQRAHNSLPTLLTTNMSEERFAKNYPRVQSVLSGKNESLVLDGEDYRPQAKDRSVKLVNMAEIEPLT